MDREESRIPEAGGNFANEGKRTTTTSTHRALTQTNRTALVLHPHARIVKHSYHNGFRERHGDFLRRGHRQSIRTRTKTLSTSIKIEG